MANLSNPDAMANPATTMAKSRRAPSPSAGSIISRMPRMQTSSQESNIPSLLRSHSTGMIARLTQMAKVSHTRSVESSTGR